ncbi:MAG: LPS export ABC transporter permease LptF, partial [Enhydrobacter sp.]
MLIFRYLAKEVCVTLVALTAILMLIFMSNQVVIYMNRAASGVIPGMLVMQLMLLELPNLLSLLLPLGFYVALLLAYGRLYAESEMTVLQACGYGQGKLLQHSLIMALVVALITTSMMLASPWIAYKRAKLLQTTGVKTLIQTLLPGRFRALPGGNQVFYVESILPDHLQAKNIFFARQIQLAAVPQWDIIWAENARLTTDPHTHEDYVELMHGKKYLGQPGSSAYQIASFDSYKNRLPHPDQHVKNDPRTIKLADLWPLNNPDRIKAAELQWRLSVPLMVFVLTLVAVPLSRVNPRSGKYAKLLPAILLYILY